ncbi:MAG: tetratricopeptide repeat protein [Candidatus Cloacimonadota bacterium]
MASTLTEQQSHDLQELLDHKADLSQEEVARRLAEFEHLVEGGKISLKDDLYPKLKMEKARLFAMSGDYRSSLEALQEVHEACLVQNNHECDLRCMNNMALVKKQLGELFEAIEIWEKLLQEDLDTGSRVLYTNNLGVAYNRAMKPKQAIKAYFAALELLDNQEQSDSAADIYNNLGNINRSSGNMEKALEYFYRALDIYTNLQNSQRIAMIFNNLAATYNEMQDLENSDKYCILALEHYKKYMPEHTMSIVLNNYAALRTMQLRFVEAKQLYTDSLDIAHRYNDEEMQTKILNNLALIAIEQEDPDLAIKFAEESRTIAHRTQDLISEKNAYSCLKDAWQSKRDFAQAYLAQSVELVLIGRINQNNTPLDIAQAEARFLQQQLEAQLEIYRKQNEALEQSNQIILEKTREMETQNNLLMATNQLMSRIISIITHDVRGPVATIAQIAELLSSGELEERREETLKQLHISAQRTEGLIEDLLYLASRYKSGLDEDPTELDLYDTLQDGVKLAETVATPKGIKLDFYCNRNPLRIMIAKERLRLIIRNLISNAIKFSNPGSTIHLDVLADDETLRIIVRDEGRGMTDKQVGKILAGAAFSELGTNQEKGFGMGLVFVLEAIIHTRGTLQIESKPGLGSAFIISYHMEDLAVEPQS